MTDFNTALGFAPTASLSYGVGEQLENGSIGFTDRIGVDVGLQWDDVRYNTADPQRRSRSFLNAGPDLRAYAEIGDLSRTSELEAGVKIGGSLTDFRNSGLTLSRTLMNINGSMGWLVNGATNLKPDTLGLEARIRLFSTTLVPEAIHSEKIPFLIGMQLKANTDLSACQAMITGGLAL